MNSHLAPRHAAAAAGVKVSTLRDWVRRGLLRRTGPADRPYALADVLAAKNAAKPRRVA